MEKRGTLGGNLALLIGSWLIPGLGFIVRGKYARGLTILGLITLTFIIGMRLHATVIIPEFHYSSPNFNIVNVLTFIGQLGNLGASLFALAHEHWHWTVFRTIESHPWFDLASLYLLVAGCMNYFCVMNFYDRYIGGGDESDGAVEVET